MAQQRSSVTFNECNSCVLATQLYDNTYLLINSICQCESIRFLGDRDSRILQRAVVSVHTGLVILQASQECVMAAGAVDQLRLAAGVFVLTLSKFCSSRDRSLILPMSSPFLFRSSITLCGEDFNMHSSVGAIGIVCYFIAPAASQ